MECHKGFGHCSNGHGTSSVNPPPHPPSSIHIPPNLSAGQDVRKKCKVLDFDRQWQSDPGVFSELLWLKGSYLRVKIDGTADKKGKLVQGP